MSGVETAGDWDSWGFWSFWQHDLGHTLQVRPRERGAALYSDAAAAPPAGARMPNRSVYKPPPRKTKYLSRLR